MSRASRPGRALRRCQFNPFSCRIDCFDRKGAYLTFAVRFGTCARRGRSEAALPRGRQLFGERTAGRGAAARRSSLKHTHAFDALTKLDCHLVTPYLYHAAGDAIAYGDLLTKLVGRCGLQLFDTELQALR